MPEPAINNTPPAGGDDNTPPPDSTSAPDQEPAAEPTSWRENLADDLSANEKLANFDSVEGLAKAFIEAPVAVEVPNADEYQLPEAGIPDGFGEFANQNGLTQDQVNSLMEYNGTLDQHKMEGFEQQQLQELETVFESWGDKKDTNLSLANRALTQFDGEGKMRAYLEASRAGNNPMVVEFLYNVGKTLEEDGFLKSEVNAQKPQASRADRLYPNQGK